MAHESDWDVVVERSSAPWVHVAGAALVGGLLGVMLADPGVTGPSIAMGLLPSLVAALAGISIAGYRVRSARAATNDAGHSLGIRLLAVVAIFCMAGAMAVAETWTLQLVAPHTSLTARFALLGAGVAGLASWWAWRTVFTATSR